MQKLERHSPRHDTKLGEEVEYVVEEEEEEKKLQ